MINYNTQTINIFNNYSTTIKIPYQSTIDACIQTLKEHNHSGVMREELGNIYHTQLKIGPTDSCS